MGTRSDCTNPGCRRLPRVSAAAAITGILALATAARLAARDVRNPPAAVTLGSAGTAARGQTSAPRGAAFPARAGQAPNDSAAVAATLERFHAALAAGDSAAALALLTPGVVILESGGVESLEEYRAHHLPADIAFARAVKSERGPIRVAVRGDVAWASSTSVTQGEYRGRTVNSAGAELAVLARTPQGWRIAALHWSSRTRRAPGG